MEKNSPDLPEFWRVKDAAKKGGIIRRNKYGSLGTLESRKKGGFKTQEKFRLDPGFAKKAGAIVRKEINYSNNPELLAEFIGILLGDGGITNYQVKITFNRDTDRLYSKFIQDTIKRLFNISSSIIESTSDKGNDVIVSSRNLVEFLLDKGLKTGSKIRNRADIPKWIYKRYEYKIGCIRGLIDTDGSFYLYEPTVNNKEYLHFAMCFTNHSKALLNSVYCLLRELGFKPVKTEKRIYLYKNTDIMRYFDIINSNNPKHYIKYKQYINEKKLSKVPQARNRK